MDKEKLYCPKCKAEIVLDDQSRVFLDNIESLEAMMGWNTFLGRMVSGRRSAIRVFCQSCKSKIEVCGGNSPKVRMMTQNEIFLEKHHNFLSGPMTKFSNKQFIIIVILLIIFLLVFLVVPIFNFLKS